MKWFFFFKLTIIYFAPTPKKKYEGEPIYDPYPIKKNFLQAFDIMKHSAKYEHRGLI